MVYRNTNKMKFDHVIMNPPYCRNLHLKILNEAINHSDDIVNLSPIRWLQDPLAEYKRNSDFKKFTEIRERIESIEIIKVTDAESLFNIGLPYNIGIYHLTKDGGWVNTFNKPLLSKMIEKVISTDNVNKHVVVDDLDGISLLLSMFTGGCSGRLENENTFMIVKERSYFTNKINEFTNETYLEQRTRTAWGNVKPKATNTNIKFTTREERDNFYDSWNTKTLRWMFNAMKVDVNVHSNLLPWLGDYTRTWTDEDLYKYFNLSDDEIKIIESEIK